MAIRHKYVMSGEDKQGNAIHATERHSARLRFYFCRIVAGRSLVVLTKTIIKSRIVQKLVKYLQKPRASHFRSISTLKSAQKPRLVQ